MKYFKIDEFFVSSVAKKYGIRNVPVTDEESERVCRNIEKLVDNILDPLREWWGYPIYITSGYRSPRLNELVGGSPTSDHRLGRAADIRPFHVEQGTERYSKCLDGIYRFITENLHFDQLIYYKKNQFIHVSYREPSANRHEIIIKR